MSILKCINDNQKVQSSDVVSIISDVTHDYKLTDKDLEDLCELLTWLKQLKILNVANNHITGIKLQGHWQ